MTKIHTHYDNLMVSRNAPFAVIQASYRTLSKKFHPDTSNTDDSLRVMKIINTSYEVLSDSEKRRVYDIQLRELERMANNLNSEYKSKQPQRELSSFAKFLMRHPVLRMLFFSVAYTLSVILRYPRSSIVTFVIVFIWISSLTNSPKSNTKSYVAPNKVNSRYSNNDRSMKLEQRGAYQRPELAPNNALWPNESGYLYGFKKLNMEGKSTIQIENLQNENDFYVKLIDTSSATPMTVRHFLVKGGQSFTISDVSKGKYRLMYLDIDGGNLTKSEEFEIKQELVGRYIKADRMKVTLYKVKNGNFYTEGIDFDEFMRADSPNINEGKSSKSSEADGMRNLSI